MTYSVYWIHHPNHTDMFTQGYVGVTASATKRFNEHKVKTQNKHLQNAINKYGWNNLVKEVVLIADKAYCLMIELKLRAEDSVGWNIIKGGGMPPKFIRTGWNHTEEANEKNRQAHLGKKVSDESKKKLSDSLKKVECATRFKKGIVAYNKGMPALLHVTAAVVKACTGRVHSQEEKEKRSKSMMGHKTSDSTKEKIRIANKKCKIECPHCNKVGIKGAMIRWHMDNCKFKGVK